MHNRRHLGRAPSQVARQDHNCLLVGNYGEHEPILAKTQWFGFIVPMLAADHQSGRVQAATTNEDA